MFQTFCQTLFHMTWTAAAAALAVMALRLVLRRTPKWIVCALWLVVFLRMVCPVSFTLPVHVIPEPPAGVAGEQLTILGYTTEPVTATEIGEPHNYLVEPNPETGDPGVVITRTIDPYSVLMGIWGAGMAGMLLWGTVSYARLRRRIADAVLVEGNVYETDCIDSPFVCGLLRPRIYLPVGLSDEDKRYVLLHERAHIVRGDHWTRLLAWLALSLHWFNPVLWLAYRLYGRDVETACDQRVIRDFDRQDVAGYAAALLHLGRREAMPRAALLAFGEENAKGRIRHVMDFKNPRRLVLLAAAAVCVIVGVLLLGDPGERNDQLEGVQITVARVLDQGVPVDLPQSHELVQLVRKYDKEDYNDLNSYLPAAGDVVLSDAGGGTQFYLTASLDRELVLVRRNHDGYSWSSTLRGATLTGLKDDPAYQAWQGELEDYLTTGRADELYALRTAYIGNHVADGEILKALNVAGVAGSYTMELQTDQEPYGLTLHLEDFPSLETEQTRTAEYLHQVGILFVALVDNASFFHWDCVKTEADGTVRTLAGSGVQPGLQKPVDRDAFQALYTAYREALGKLGSSISITGETTRYSLGNALYLSPEMPWRDMPMYLGNVTIARDVFSVQMAHALSSAWPDGDSYANPVYRQVETPDEIVLRDDAWPSQEYLELVQAQEPPLAADGILPLGVFQERACLEVCDQNGTPTPYRLYRLDRSTWLSHETDGVADWVFSLTEQPGTPQLPDETEE